MQGGNGGNSNPPRPGMPTNMPGMMQMGMGMPMMPMGMPMGMPMMNQMMAMMNPMMAMNVNANANASPPAAATTPAPAMPTVPLAAKVPSPVEEVKARERSRSREVPVAPPKPPVEREKTPPRCHLHNVKKPNAKCKFCQKWLASQNQLEQCRKVDEKEEAKHQKVTMQQAVDDEEDYSRRTFKCSSLLKDQIFGSSYFKSLLEVSDLEPLAEEITRYADTLDVYNSGNNVHPSCFICQVYRLFTLPQSEDLDELLAVLDASPSAKVRCAGLLYVRFVVPPQKLWERLEENLFDEQELKYVDGDKQVTTTIQEYVENLLLKDKYYNTPLPRIPVKVRQHLEKELAPLSQYRKRLVAMQKALPKQVAGTLVEVYVDGKWEPGVIRAFIGVRRRKVGVKLDNGALVSSHLGKVILKGEYEEEEEVKEEKEKEKEPKAERSTSRSRSRRSRSRRRKSPDWARYRGPTHDSHDIERLREKAREEAVVGVGKVYSKRPTTVEGEMWRGSGGDARVSMLGPQHTSGGASRSSAKGHSDPEMRSRMSREEEEEHKKRMREIYEKYGSVSRATSTSGSQKSEIDQPDVLRLG